MTSEVVIDCEPTSPLAWWVMKYDNVATQPSLNQCVTFYASERPYLAGRTIDHWVDGPVITKHNTPLHPLLFLDQMLS